MTSFVDRLFLSPEELGIATEISAITNPTTTPIPGSVTVRTAESLQRIVDPRLQSYAAKLLTEPFLNAQDSWRGVVGVCAVLLHLANTDSYLPWLDTILKLCREIGDHFEHEDARVRSLVRMEALSVVKMWGSGTANTHARPATVEGEGSSVSIPTWDELSAEEDPSFDKVTVFFDVASRTRLGYLLEHRLLPGHHEIITSAVSSSGRAALAMVLLSRDVPEVLSKAMPADGRVVW
ncbi:hypothetical protein FOZ61_007503 [Perkinsus olseni]|uniref:Uncharacterized protein n=1 Tax=Perkinsus olseni TaxID=32597 RepID=A0A7J6LIG0_PEROL|nr:hypothetical protein FOZ61_007503 [Perkinsus olseni]KAF4658926.1 hypothetical protein FOL46_006790 [Perkinsus olseni]